jgi:6-phosphogluconolactonase
MDEIEWWEFDTAAELAEQVVGDIGFVIESAVGAHGNARIALPGEGAPEPLLTALAKAKDVDWAKVTILPTDDSLPAQAAPRFGKLFGAKGGTVMPLVENGTADVQSGARQADTRLAELHWPLDLVCLAVGADGRVAGIGPGPELDRAISGPRERRAIAAGNGITLTGAALSSARAVMIVIQGAETRRTLEQAIKDGPLSALPIGRLLAAIDTPIDIFCSAE